MIKEIKKQNLKSSKAERGEYLTMSDISEKQLNFAQKIADSLGSEIPKEVLNDRFELSSWIDGSLDKLPKDEEGRIVFKPSLKQIAFAERISEDAGVEIPVACYRSSVDMAKFIDTYQSRLKNRPTEKMIDLAKKIQGSYPTDSDPANCFESFDELREWLDRNFPEDWKNFSGTSVKRPGGRGKRKKSLEELL